MAGSGLLPRLEELGDVPPHLAELQLPPVPQQLDPRDRQLQQRLAAPRPPAHSAREPNQNWNHTNRTDNQSSTRNPPPQKRRNPARTYHLAPRKPPPPPPLKKASSIDMSPGEGCGGVGSGHPIGSARAAGGFARGGFDLKRGKRRGGDLREAMRWRSSRRGPGRWVRVARDGGTGSTARGIGAVRCRHVDGGLGILAVFFRVGFCLGDYGLWLRLGLKQTLAKSESGARRLPALGLLRSKGKLGFRLQIGRTGIQDAHGSTLKHSAQRANMPAPAPLTADTFRSIFTYKPNSSG